MDRERVEWAIDRARAFGTQAIPERIAHTLSATLSEVDAVLADLVADGTVVEVDGAYRLRRP